LQTAWRVRVSASVQAAPKPRGDLAAREDTCFHHTRQTPNGTGSQVVGERLQPPPRHRCRYGSDTSTSPVPHSHTRQSQARAKRRARQATRFCGVRWNRCPFGASFRGTGGAGTALASRAAGLTAANRRQLAAATATESVVGSPVFKLWNESRTNRARIADSLLVRIRSRRHVVACSGHTTTSCKWRRLAKRSRAAIR
jgi:hypothetical protein